MATPKPSGLNGSIFNGSSAAPQSSARPSRRSSRRPSPSSDQAALIDTIEALRVRIEEVEKDAPNRAGTAELSNVRAELEAAKADMETIKAALARPQASPSADTGSESRTRGWNPWA